MLGNEITARVMRDLDWLDTADRDHPVPMVTAPWRGGPVEHAILYPGEEPPTIHLWSHFEVFPSATHMLRRWVIDDAMFNANGVTH